MATFVALFEGGRDMWALQTFLQCHLATEETLCDRIEITHDFEYDANYWIDGDSLRLAWWPSGIMKVCVRTKHGNLHGWSKAWHSDGSWRYRVGYKDGRRHGLAEHWSESGLKWFCQMYEHGKMIGGGRSECGCSLLCNENLDCQ